MAKNLENRKVISETISPRPIFSFCDIKRVRFGQKFSLCVSVDLKNAVFSKPDPDVGSC